MGEHRRRELLGFPPRAPLGPQPYQQVMVDTTNASPVVCSCGCKYFQYAVEVYSFSAIVSPTGQEGIGHRPALVCLHCGEPLHKAPAMPSPFPEAPSP